MTFPAPSPTSTPGCSIDNTLYLHHVNLWQQVDARIGESISAYLHLRKKPA
jgi:putative hydrolase of the HAD superfamily